MLNIKEIYLHSALVRWPTVKCFYLFIYFNLHNLCMKFYYHIFNLIHWQHLLIQICTLRNCTWSQAILNREYTIVKKNTAGQVTAPKQFEQDVCFNLLFKYFTLLLTKLLEILEKLYYSWILIPFEKLS